MMVAVNIGASSIFAEVMAWESDEISCHSCTSDLQSLPLATTIVQAMLSKCWIKDHANLAGSSAP